MQFISFGINALVLAWRRPANLEDILTSLPFHAAFKLCFASSKWCVAWKLNEKWKETIWCLMFSFFQCTVSNSMRAMQKWTKGQMSGRLSLVECSSFLAYLASSSFGRKCIVSKRCMVFPPESERSVEIWCEIRKFSPDCSISKCCVEQPSWGPRGSCCF